MKNYFSKWLIFLFVLIFSFLFLAVPVHAEEHYDSYHYDKWKEAIPSQAGYSAQKAVSGQDLNTIDFSAPADLFIDKNQKLFIVDSGNNRIVITDSHLTKISKILTEFTYSDGKKTTLNQPQGIYISPETDFIYIADYQNSRVLVSDRNGRIQMEITKPDSVLFSQELTFLPQKVLADKAGNIYVILGNITTGAAMFSPQGEFLGYYGANAVEPTSKVIADYFWKLVSTEEMRSRTARTVPSAITNFDSDKEGFLYTCTQSASQQKDTVKKLNAAGTNLFSQSEITWGDYQTVYDTLTNKNYQSMFCDIEISEDGSINCLDITSGKVFQYDKEGNLLFIFGSISEQLGGFTQPSAIESAGHEIFVLDSRKNTVTVFEETNFGAMVHQATDFYNSGYYEEALEPWFQVLQYDGNYQRAFLGIASALLIKGDFKGSMQYARLADSSIRYNKAFECFRTEWLTQHSYLISFTMILLTVILFRSLRKKAPQTKCVADFTEKQWLNYTVLHPVNGFRLLRWKQTGSFYYAIIILLLWFAGTIFYYRIYGFQFRSEPDKIFNMIPYFMQTILLFSAWVVGNWAVCTLLNGEGKMKNIFLYSAYALVPYVICLYTEVMLSHFLIRDEQVFIELIHLTGLLWSGIMIFSAVQTVHQYSFRKTLGAILLTICAMLVMLFLFILILSLFQQIYLFIYSIYTEIAYRLKV